jgi:ankyrin repeat protein
MVDLVLSMWSRYGRSALAAAAQAEQVDIVKLLSKEGADVDTENKQGLTPLMVAVRDEKAKVVVSQTAMTCCAHHTPRR